MKAAIRSSALARIFLVAGFGVALSAMPASAQKQGGSITVGLELDIPGFDPLKVGVYDTAALTASSAIFDTLTSLDDNGKAAAQARAVLDPFRRLQDLDLQAASRRQVPRRHAVQRRGLQGQFRPAEGSREQVPLRLLHRQHQQTFEAPDELTVVYNLNDPSVNFPAMLISYANQNGTIHSPTAWKTKGDDYNRNPVGTGPYVLKSWTAGDRMVLEHNPNYWDKGKLYLDRIVLKPLPDAQSRFASLQSGETDLVWDDEYDADNIQKAQKNSKLTVHTYVGSGAAVARLQHQGRRRSTTCACARRW